MTSMSHGLHRGRGGDAEQRFTRRESLEHARGHWEALRREDKAAEIIDLLDEV